MLLGSADGADDAYVPGTTLGTMLGSADGAAVPRALGALLGILLGQLARSSNMVLVLLLVLVLSSSYSFSLVNLSPCTPGATVAVTGGDSDWRHLQLQPEFFLAATEISLLLVGLVLPPSVYCSSVGFGSASSAGTPSSSL